MKILFKIWTFPEISETFILAQIITAINCGYKVNILVRDLKSFQESSQKPIIDRYNIQNKVIIDDPKVPGNKFYRIIKGIGLVILNVRSFSQIYDYLKEEKKYWTFSGIYRFLFYRKFNSYDIIHVQYGTNAKPFDLLKKIGGISSKLVVSFHGHDAFFPINGIIPNNGFYKDLFKQGNLIVVNTPYLKKVLQNLQCPREKLEVIPVGVDTSYFFPSFTKRILEKPFKLVTVGRLDKIKGHKFLIEVMENLKNSGTPVFLTIIGEGPQRIFLEKLIEEKNLSKIIKLIGSRNQEEVREILWEHHIYLLASIPLENGRQETQGLATIEAQACGLPAIVFDSGGVKYTVEDGKTGFVIPRGDSNFMTKKIIELIENPDLYSEMSSNAKTFIEENYSLKVIEERWCNIYEELIYE